MFGAWEFRDLASRIVARLVFAQGFLVIVSQAEV